MKIFLRKLTLLAVSRINQKTWTNIVKNLKKVEEENVPQNVHQISPNKVKERITFLIKFQTRSQGKQKDQINILAMSAVIHLKENII